MEEEKKDQEKVSKEKGKNNNKMLISIIVIVVLLIIIVPLVVFGIGIYKLNWNDTYTQKVYNTLPYPAAMVGSGMVKYSEFVSNVDSLNHFYEKQEELGMAMPGVAPSEEDIKKDELDRLVKKNILLKLAKQKNITVTSEEIDEKFNTEILPQAQGGEDEISQTLDELYGWSVDDFKANVIEEMIYREKLTTELESELDEMVKGSAQDVLDKALAGDSFEELAAEFGEDGTAATGGDLGFFEQGVMVAEFDTVVFEKATVGEVYPELVKTSFGYHIIKLEEFKEAEGEDGKKQAKARHILISNNLDKYLDQEVENTKIIKFVAK
ncbi:MAG: peptidylprolyl isomerase [Patescibacteria group bacterium]